MAMPNTIVDPAQVAAFMAQRKAAKEAPKPTSGDKLAWVNVDMNSLDEIVQGLVATLLNAEATAKVAREALAECLAEDYVTVPAGTSLRVGMKWGKLSYAFAPIEAPRSGKNAVALVRKG